MTPSWPPGARVTAYAWSAAHGLPCDTGSLAALGLAAARHARWAGIPPWRVPEGPPGAQLWVHAWPEAVFDYVITVVPCPGCGDIPPAGPGLCPGCTAAWGGRPPSGSYAAWRAEGRVPLTRVVHCKREPYDVLIDRSTPWGNPYRIGRDGDRAQVIAAYRRYLAGRADLLASIPALRGKRLGCWCKPLPCHGDVLAALADNPATAGSASIQVAV